MLGRTTLRLRAPLVRRLATSRTATVPRFIKFPSVRSYATQVYVKPERKPHPFRWGLVIGLAIGVSWAYIERHGVQLEETDKIQPPTKCDPFPRKIEVQGDGYDVLGVGYRAVTFMNFHVYALGLYVAKDDVAKAHQVLDKIADLSGALADPDRSAEVVGSLLDNGVRFAVRIVPVRDTDFLHIRDGLVRSVMANAEFKKLGPDSGIGDGLNELKQTFGRKRKIAKGDVITIAQLKNGKLYSTFALKETQSSPEELGYVDNANVGRLLFLQYLSGKNPNSPTACKSSHEGLVAL